MRRTADSIAASKPDFKAIAVCGSVACTSFLVGTLAYGIGKLLLETRSQGKLVCVFLSNVVPLVGVTCLLVMKM
ncbi:hypothetical protein BC830DRAFT_1099277 [Chytriomyces sp. MP71]|nr:hypothetical protein BC830DRAFT_1099277 [Chytriomyces sp. MP71]